MLFKFNVVETLMWKLRDELSSTCSNHFIHSFSLNWTFPIYFWFPFIYYVTKFFLFCVRREKIEFISIESFISALRVRRKWIGERNELRLKAKGKHFQSIIDDDKKTSIFSVILLFFFCWFRSSDNPTNDVKGKYRSMRFSFIIQLNISSNFHLSN